MAATAQASNRAELLRSSTSYRRWDVEHGLLLWIYEYWGREPIHHTGMTTGLEIGVQLEGRWLHEGSLLGKRLFDEGTIHRINIGERFRVSYDAAAGRGVQVGFALFVTEVPELRGLGAGELRFDREAGLRDRELVEVSRWLHCDPWDERRRVEARRALIAFVERHAELTPIDPLMAAKRELERYFDCELRVEHVAEVAKMHPVTFARRFKRRFGVTPAHYRVNWRLHHAARLLRTRPAARVSDIASECGFHHSSYFHGLFRERFGLPPAEWRRDR